MALNTSFLQELLTSVGERGRSLLANPFGAGDPTVALADCARALMSGRGEASGVALAQEVLAKYQLLDGEGQRVFFRWLATELAPDVDRIRSAAEGYMLSPDETNRRALARAVEAPRVEFFRRLNRAPGATAALVQMRADLLAAMRHEPDLSPVDQDLLTLLESWFNRGFLVMRRIDWSIPAAILEKIIAYEAVHEIQGWEDLRRRLEPSDRRCFAFFHPSLVDEPLIFVEVALTTEIPGSIQALLAEKPRGPDAPTPTTAVFYSISNCQEGLRGISFGNFLIKQVVEDLAHELPSLRTFVTLSPVPRFARWLDRASGDQSGEVVTEADRIALQVLNDPGWVDDGEDGETEVADSVRPTVNALAAHYFLVAKDGRGMPVDPVARFHLGNGARLERINWLGDVSEKGLREAHGLMVNYLYDLREIEKNHEGFANMGTIAAARAVRSLLRPASRALLNAKIGPIQPEPAEPAEKSAPPAAEPTALPAPEAVEITGEVIEGADTPPADKRTGP